MGYYVFPSKDLLNYDTSMGHNTKKLQEMKSELHSFFSRKGVGASVVDVIDNPITTIFALKLEPGIRVNKVTSLKEELMRGMQVENIEFLVPLPGTSYVGIQIPKSDVKPLLLGNLLRYDTDNELKGKFEIPLGRNYDQKTVSLNLRTNPNLLIGGYAVDSIGPFIDSLIVSLLYKNRPDELKFIMIGLKDYNLNIYANLPHTLFAAVNDRKKAQTAIDFAFSELEERIKKFSDVHARNLEDYNTRMRQVGQNELPHVMLVIDGYWKYSFSDAEETEEKIITIARYSQRVGFHLVVKQGLYIQTTKRDIVSEISERIMFKTSNDESKKILGAVGAETLSPKGEALYKSRNSSELVRLITPYISDEEVSNITSFIVDLGKVKPRLTVNDCEKNTQPQPLIKRINVDNSKRPAPQSIKKEDQTETAHKELKIPDKTEIALNVLEKLDESLHQEELKVSEINTSEKLEDHEIINKEKNDNVLQQRKILIDPTYAEKMQSFSVEELFLMLPLFKQKDDQENLKKIYEQIFLRRSNDITPILYVKGDDPYSLTAKQYVSFFPCKVIEVTCNDLNEGKYNITKFPTLVVYKNNTMGTYYHLNEILKFINENMKEEEFWGLCNLTQYRIGGVIVDRSTANQIAYDVAFNNIRRAVRHLRGATGIKKLRASEAVEAYRRKMHAGH